MSTDVRALIAAITNARDFRTVASLLTGSASGTPFTPAALKMVIEASRQAWWRLDAANRIQVSAGRHAIQVSRQALRSGADPLLLPQMFDPFRHEGPTVSRWQADHGL